MENTSDLGGVAAFTNGAAVAPTVAAEIKERRRGGWYPKLVARYLKRNVARARSEAARSAASTETPHARATAAIRWACAKSAISGALAGLVSTGATLFTAQTEGVGGILAGPVAALAIGGEMIFRSVLHIELTCELAQIFEVEVDPEDDDDIWRLYALSFGTHRHEKESADPGRELVGELASVEEGEEIGEKIGQKVLGESVMRNIVPVLGIFTSAVTNYLTTRDLGDNVRRYMRYQHALDREGSRACIACGKHLDLVIEGMWFIFSADGKLDPEEAAFLSHMLQKIDDPLLRHAVLGRFVEDELDWTIRIKAEVPESSRDEFMHVLEVAAAVDKEVGLPERKILRRAARALGREYSQERVEQMIAQFEESGVLGRPPASEPRAEPTIPEAVPVPS
jgi:uncharacterized tellurite resistance protein B-like protein